MKYIVSFGAFVGLAVCLMLASPGVTQAPTPIPSVWLQSSSPGTAQTGNINVSGRYVGAMSLDNAKAMSISANGDNVKGIFINATGFHPMGIDIASAGGGLRATSSNGIGVSGIGTTYGVYGFVSDAGGVGVIGQHSGNGNGLQGLSDSGIGVYGISGLYGVKGDGIIGVFGSSASSTGVQGTSNGASGNGVVGQTSGANGYGVVGNNTGGGIGIIAFGSKGVKANGTTSDGVYGETLSNVAAGVSGVNTANGLGVYASSVGGYGVQGTGGGFAGVYGSGATNGLYGLTGNNGASGVYGLNSSTGWGVYGASSGSGTGVSGYNPDPSGYGVFSNGRLTATGTKSFQIDDPFDPENKYLNHFCTEGAEPLNAYSGSVITDAKGYATVALPEYFSEINKDPRIQLTVVDKSDDFVLAKVVDEVSGNGFRLRTSKPQTKVFWRVEAVRNDNWVKRNGFKDIEEKPARYRGTYLNPEFFAQPVEKGQFYVQPAPIAKHKLGAGRTN